MTKAFEIRTITKSGAHAKNAYSCYSSGRTEFSYEEAKKIKDRMEKNNPGKIYDIIELPYELTDPKQQNAARRINAHLARNGVRNRR